MGRQLRDQALRGCERRLTRVGDVVEGAVIKPKEGYRELEADDVRRALNGSYLASTRVAGEVDHQPFWRLV